MIAEIANDDGSMSRLKECHALARQNGFVLTTVEKIVEYRQALAKAQGPSVELLAECEIPIQRQNKYLGTWTMR